MSRSRLISYTNAGNRAIIFCRTKTDVNEIVGRLNDRDFSVAGALHPVEEVWAPPPPRTSRLGPRGVPREFLAHVAATVRRALAERTGDVLSFLPTRRSGWPGR